MSYIILDIDYYDPLVAELQTISILNLNLSFIPNPAPAAVGKKKFLQILL